MPIKQKVLIASSLHPWDDPRIFYKQCHSLKKHYDLTLIAVSERKLFNKDDIRIIGLSKPKSLVYRLVNSVKIVREVFKEKYIIFHFHDPELLWVGFIVKLSGKKVIFDIHENILGIVQMRSWIPDFLRKPLGLITLFSIVPKIAAFNSDRSRISDRSYLLKSIRVEFSPS